MPKEAQLSFQKEVELPDDITFLKPESRRGLVALQAAQVLEHEPLDNH